MTRKFNLLNEEFELVGKTDTFKIWKSLETTKWGGLFRLTTSNIVHGRDYDKWYKDVYGVDRVLFHTGITLKY